MNGRFQIAIHILTLLEKAEGQLVSSDYIAGSINANPALVRKEISSLRKSGFISSKEGKNGGYELGKSAEQITFADIYRSFGKPELLGRAKNIPNPDCIVGKQINQHIENLYQQLDNDLLTKLGHITLAEFSDRFK